MHAQGVWARVPVRRRLPGVENPSGSGRLSCLGGSGSAGATHGVVRHLAPILCTLSLVLFGCPGSLEDPDRFNARDGGADAGTDAGTGFVCPSANLSVKAQLINTRCGNAGCHDSSTKSGGLDLASEGSPARLVNVSSTSCAGKTYVTADGGYLIEKINPSPMCGSQMPIGTPLTASEKQCLIEWTAHISSGGAE